jgi:signal transduction histidine kinase
MSPANPLASIRFRLTAWYALVLALILAALGFAVVQLAGNRLQADMDARLSRTADDIASVIARSLVAAEPFAEEIPFDAIAPSLASFSSRGLLVQILGPDGSVIRRSEAAPGEPMMALPNSPATADLILRTETVNGWTIRVAEYPLVLQRQGIDERVLGAVLVGERTDTMEETLRTLRQVLLLTSIAGLAFAAVTGWLLAGRALAPVDRMTAAAAAIASEGGPPSLFARLPQPGGNDELSRLAGTFNVMLDRIAAAFATQRRFVADASHELRTPLAAIRGNVEVVGRQLASLPADTPLRDDLVDAAGDINRESARMGRLLDDLLLLARTDASNAGSGPSALREPLAPTRLDEIARAALRSASGLAAGQTLVDRSTPATVLGDPDRLQQVALALLDNAIRHTPPGGSVTIETGLTGDGYAYLRVRDDGDGIAPEHLPHLFDRFYRADSARGRVSGGTGLGLAIARAIVQAHRGEITVESEPDGGSSFTILLPVAPPDAMPLVASETAPLPRDDRSSAD